jgi:hypothetical protein
MKFKKYFYFLFDFKNIFIFFLRKNVVKKIIFNLKLNYEFKFIKI